MLTKSEPYRIGYALPPKKIQSFIQPSLINQAKRHNIDLIPIHPSIPLIQQGPFHCIIHKLYAPDWKSQLQHFSSQNPHVPVIDSPHLIDRLRSRVSMLQVVTSLKICKTNAVLDVPQQHVVSDLQTLKTDGDLISGLGFPLIAKPLMADGSDTSHQLYLVFDNQGLEKLDTPIVLQEFVNHGGVIFKVYVAGDHHVHCVKRKSLPDIKQETLPASKGLLPFSQLSNLCLQDKSEFGEVEMPPADFVDEVAKGIKEETGITLFNFDVIRDGRDANRYLVIDINYFPGYEKMPNYESVMTGVLLDIVGMKKGGDVGPWDVRDREHGKQD